MRIARTTVARQRILVLLAILHLANRGCADDGQDAQNGDDGQDAQNNTSTSLDQCNAKYPSLFSRVDRELAPWWESGITSAMMERRLSCPADLEERHPLANRSRAFRKKSKQHYKPDWSNYEGIHASIVRDGDSGAPTVHVHEQHRCTPGRVMGIRMMLNRVAANFPDLPDVELVISCADTLPVFSEWGDPSPSRGNRSGAHNDSTYPILPPLLVAYRKQQDDMAVAFPDWTFFMWPEMEKSQEDAAANLSLSRGSISDMRHPNSLRHMVTEGLKTPGFRAFDYAGAIIRPMSHYMANIRARADRVPWSRRKPQLFFRGQPKPVRLAAVNLANHHKDVLDIKKSRGHSVGRSNVVTLEDHCHYRYLLQLQGHGASARLKYLFACKSLVVFPRVAGGTQSAPGNQYEEFFYDLLQDDVNVARVDTVRDLPKFIRKLEAEERNATERSLELGRTIKTKAQRIAEAGAEMAEKYFTEDAASCYWAHLISKLSALQKKGGHIPLQLRKNEERHPWEVDFTPWQELQGNVRNSFGRPCCCTCLQGFC